LFPPETLRRCRDSLDPGQSIIIKVRAKASEGEVRFFGDDAQPLTEAVAGLDAGLRIHVSPSVAKVDVLSKRLTPTMVGGGQVTFVAPFAGGREIELRLPGRYVLDAAVRGALKVAPGVTLLEDV
jgi:DNA polymerase-3 subunit alpha